MKIFVKYLLISVLFMACSNESEKSEVTEVDGVENVDVVDEAEAKNLWSNLFNGEDLSGWYTYQRQPEPSSIVANIAKDADGNYMEPIGLNKDPLNVFTVVEEDGAPAIRISGETFGILVTERNFSDFHLQLQFKWGDEKYPPRANEKKDSGILYHSIGKEGAWGGVWMKSLECQVQDTDCGDYISVDTVFADVPAVLNAEDNRFYYTEGAEKIKFDHNRAYCNKSEDFEKEMGEWNTMDIYTFKGNSVHVVNGQVNMRIYNTRYLENGSEVPLTRGKIQLQSEGAEIFYRAIQLTPISEIPEDLK